MLRDSVVFFPVAVAVVLTRPRAMPLAMITICKSTHRFPFLPYMSMRLRLAVLRAAGAPLLRDVHSQRVYMYLEQESLLRLYRMECVQKKPLRFVDLVIFYLQLINKSHSHSSMADKKHGKLSS